MGCVRRKVSRGNFMLLFASLAVKYHCRIAVVVQKYFAFKSTVGRNKNEASLSCSGLTVQLFFIFQMGDEPCSQRAELSRDGDSRQRAAPHSSRCARPDMSSVPSATTTTNQRTPAPPHRSTPTARSNMSSS